LLEMGPVISEIVDALGSEKLRAALPFLRDLRLMLEKA
jgi:hypothetical protein